MSRVDHPQSHYSNGFLMLIMTLDGNELVKELPCGVEFNVLYLYNYV